MGHAHWTVCIVLASVVSATRASGAPAPIAATGSTASAGSAPLEPGVHEHDGLFLHLGAGLSAFNGRLASDVLDGRMNGVSTASDIALGGTLLPGVVVGGAAFHASVLVSTFEPDEEFAGETPPREVDPTGTGLSIFGPFSTYYPDSRDGLHFDIAAGVATLTGLSYDIGQFGDKEVAVGGGFVLGVGYELWVGQQWSLGVATRLMTALVAEQDRRNVDWLLGVGTFPNVLLGVTYH